MDLLSKFSFAKKESQSWAVILKGAPDKRSEENLIHVFTERLNIPGDDALRIIRSAPIILFDERNSREAEQIKLALNQTGVRTGISNDGGELKKLPRVVWPRKIEAPELHLSRMASPPPSLPQPSLKSSKPLTPPEPKPVQAPPPPMERLVPAAPPPPVATPPASDEWKVKYQNLQESYLSAMDRLKKREAELKTALERSKKLEQDSSSLYSQLERFRKERIEEKVSELEIKLRVTAEERELAIAERDETRRRLERYEQELGELRNFRSALEKEKELFRTEKEEALRTRQQAEKAAETLRRELSQAIDSQDLFKREAQILRSDKEKLLGEIEKVKVDLDSHFDALRSQSEAVNVQLNRLEKLLEALRGTAKASTRGAAAASDAEASPLPKPQSRALHIGIAPPPTGT